MAFPAALLLPVLLPAERLINAALAVDDISRDRLGELNDKVIAIEETTLSICMAVSIVSNRVQLLNDFDGVADVTLRGDYSSLIGLVKSSDALYGSKIRIEGELGVAETLRSIVGQLDIDVESLLAPAIGGSPAHLAGRFFDQSAQWFSRTVESTQLNTKEYLQEETKMLVQPSAVNDFSDGVSDVKEAVDRAEARVRRLERSLKAKLDNAK
jgi:ubiquinone biosynthesis accessory factor UbiJ